MTTTLKRQLNDCEKETILKTHGRVCFATGHQIPESEKLQYDHIHAYAEGGVSELNNIAPMCEIHNKQKGVLALNDFRVKLRLADFFESGNALTLQHLLAYLTKSKDLAGYGQKSVITIEGDQIEVDTHSGKKYNSPLSICPTTKWKYFYATLPVEVLDSDDDEDKKIGLQPRYLILEKVFELYRHFQQHPVLQPSVGRVSNDRILLFDGQHKAAALLWNGRTDFECKIYVDPDLRLLNDTNISAHDKFAQTRFFSSIMVQKLGAEFGADFEVYKNLEDSAPKSEAGFIAYLSKDTTQTKGERNTRFRSYLYDAILSDPTNKAAKYVSNANRSTEQQPLTIDMLTKSLFTAFLYRDPVEDNMATDAYKREKEISNNIELMNMLYDLALSSWNPKASPSDNNQRKLKRIFGSKSIMAWSDIMRDAVCGKLELQDTQERERPFYRDMSEDDFDKIKKIVGRLVNWKHWDAPANDEIDSVLADNKSKVRSWFKDHILTTGYLMGASE